jgi:integrase
MESNPSTPLAAFYKLIYLPANPSTKPKTVQLYGNSLKKFHGFIGREPMLSDLSDENVGSFLRALVDAGQATETANKERANLLALWRHARAMGVIEAGPTVKRLPAPRSIPKALTVCELEKLQAAFDTLQGETGGIRNSDFLRACFAIQFTTAERVGAVLELRFADVVGDVVTFHAETRKGGRRAMIKQVPAWVIDDIERIKSPKRERIFPIEPTNKTKVFSLYDRLFKRAGVPRPKGKSSHLLRSSHATMVDLAGGDATASLGHANSEVTRRHYLDPRFKPDTSCEHLPPLDD